MKIHTLPLEESLNRPQLWTTSENPKEPALNFEELYEGWEDDPEEEPRAGREEGPLDDYEGEGDDKGKLGSSVNEGGGAEK
jgi:hypothetical protein